MPTGQGDVPPRHVKGNHRPPAMSPLAFLTNPATPGRKTERHRKARLAALGAGALLAIYALLLQFDMAPAWLGGGANSVSAVAPRSCGGHHQGPAVGSEYFHNRTVLYDSLSGPQEYSFLSSGKTSQSLKVSDLFEEKDGKLVPILKEQKVAVRANVLHVDRKEAHQMYQTVKRILSRYGFGDTAVWYQDPDMYHMSLWHASHHLDPVPASPREVGLEIVGVTQVTHKACPLRVSLDRVVLTSTGVVLGLWQLLSGTEPFDLRQQLRKNLPRSPETQLYDPVMLHTSFARILKGPDSRKGVGNESGNMASVLREAAEELDKELCGTQTTLSTLLYVEEWDLLALALDGRITPRLLPLRCGEPIT
ncbi:hypothetical protein KFL_000460190 [Klebsormidium nitens]|uniref:Uncharacterized protein n=1 Tax=Klebsormidium nitens TaxID=105231 RepID=A0A1Y1HW85_KLENI|nr:hypothetical protein KFL_000460190 [Klebsormidium nitens]|eukprot:GAQ80108.1 hypothetical protein KFL_000460190 [Klebsormidium nitens]